MDIDLDAILAKREEVTGSKDTFSFTFAGKKWTAKDPIVADDEWKEDLADCEGDIEVAEHYMGEDQYTAFVEAGGRAGLVLLAIGEFMKSQRDALSEERPTRRTTSSARRRKR